jgi:hypothetical protein
MRLAQGRHRLLAEAHLPDWRVAVKQRRRSPFAMGLAHVDDQLQGSLTFTSSAVTVKPRLN